MCRMTVGIALFLLATGLPTHAATGGDERAGEQSSQAGEEHPGTEHPGSEHPGESEEHPGEGEKEGSFGAGAIKVSMMGHIRSETRAGDGAFRIEDPKTSKELALEFVKIHDPVRELPEKGIYFACTDFRVQGGPKGKRYDLDFWLKPQGDEMEVVRTRIHKHPVKENGEWTKEARFTYRNDEPVSTD